MFGKENKRSKKQKGATNSFTEEKEEEKEKK